MGCMCLPTSDGKIGMLPKPLESIPERTSDVESARHSSQNQSTQASTGADAKGAMGSKKSAKVIPAPSLTDGVVQQQRVMLMNNFVGGEVEASVTGTNKESFPRAATNPSPFDQKQVGGHVVMYNSSEVVSSSNGTDGRRPRSSASVLINAAKSDNVKQARIALEADPTCVNSRGMWGNTALISACQYGSHNVAMLLLESGADAGAVNEHGCSALHHAALDGFVDVVNALVPKLATISEAERTRLVLPASMYNSRTDSKDAFSPLVAASSNGHRAIVQALLDANLVMADGEIELETALDEALRAGQVQAATVLLSIRGEALKPRLRASTRSLALACHSGKRELVSALIEAGSCIDGCTCDNADDSKHKSKDGPLAAAAAAGAALLVTDLLCAGADANYSCGKCSTPLMQASRAEHPDCVTALLASGADPNAKDMDVGMSPVEYAANASLKEILALLAG